MAQAVYDLFNRNAVDGLDQFIAADGVLEDIATGQTFHGPDGFRT